MDWAEELTADNDRITLFVAFNYGGRAEIVDAARALRRRRRGGVRELLYAPEMHDPDLLIRTSGEQRLSNYLLWQSAYSELVFRDELWPDFTREAFEAALAEYGDRARGGLGGRASAPRRSSSDLAARVVGGDPGDRLRGADRRRGRLVVRGRPVPARASPACTSVPHVRAANPARLAGFLGLARAARRRAARRARRRARCVAATRAGDLPALPAQPRAGAPAWR